MEMFGGDQCENIKKLKKHLTTTFSCVILVTETIENHLKKKREEHAVEIRKKEREERFENHGKIK